MTAEERGEGRRKRDLRIPDGHAPTRLDHYLTALPELNLSRTRIQKLIKAGEVLVDDRLRPARFLLKGGEVISIVMSEPPVSDVLPEDLPIDIVYEDEYLAVVNKPAGMVTHPAAGVYSGTLVNALVHHFQGLPSAYGAERPGIVHRLDKNTSGLLLVAKQEQTLLALQHAMQRREISRTYLALVCGHMPDKTGAIELPIGRSTTDRTKMAVSPAGGRVAATDYRLLDRFRSYDLLEVSLRTGRTHQIRVHFSHLGHPVFGDPEYGGREKWHRGIFAPERLLAKRLLTVIDRQALHAQRLNLAHPATGRLLTVQADPPKDFQRLLELLHQHGR